MIPYSSPRNESPEVGASLNPLSSLGRVLTNAWIGNTLSGTDIIGNVLAPPPANISLTSSIIGSALTTSSSLSGTAKATKSLVYPYVQIGYGYFTSSASNHFLSAFTSSGYTSYLRLESATSVGFLVRYNFGTSRNITITLPTALNTPICIIVVVYSDTDYRLFANGLQVNGSLSPGTLGTGLNTYNPIGHSLVGGIAFSGFGSGKALSDAEALTISANPQLIWESFIPQQRYLPTSITSGGAYTLTANSGSYTLSGQDATILKSKVLNADQGTYTLTGQSASLFRSKVINAAQGSYALTGQSSTILRSKVLTAGQGSYTLTGQNATITYTGSGVNYTITADVGNYTYTGQAATIKKSKVLNASTGTYNVAGQAATLAYSGSNIVTLKAGSWIRYRTI